MSRALISTSVRTAELESVKGPTAGQSDLLCTEGLRCQALLRYICDAIGRYADGPRTARLRRHPRHLRVRPGPLASGIWHQYVLHVADEGREPQGLQGERGGIP